MELPHLYTLVWEYREGWNADRPLGTGEAQQFFYIEGRAEGRISGRFRGTNHSRRRSDDTYLPNVQGVIQTDEGDVIVDYRGYGAAPHPSNEPHRLRRVMLNVRHATDDEALSFLNDAVAVGIGENRMTDDNVLIMMAKFYEIPWEAVDDLPTERPQIDEPVSIAPHAFPADDLAARRRSA